MGEGRVRASNFETFPSPFPFYAAQSLLRLKSRVAIHGHPFSGSSQCFDYSASPRKGRGDNEKGITLCYYFGCIRIAPPG